MLMCNVGLSPCNVYIVVLNIIYDHILENLYHLSTSIKFLFFSYCKSLCIYLSSVISIPTIRLKDISHGSIKCF